MFNIYDYFCINKFSFESNSEDERTVYEDKNKNYIISNCGRVLFIGNEQRIKRTINRYCRNSCYKRLILTREAIELNQSQIKLLMLYLHYADKFLLFLIENNFRDFNSAIREYDDYKYFDMLTYEEKESLLKPVYYRYSRKTSKELRNLEIKLKKEEIHECNLPKKLVLYNLPYKLIDSQLEVLGLLKLDLREKMYGNHYNSYFLGKIKEFDKIEIDILSNERYTFFKEIRLIYKGLAFE